MAKKNYKYTTVQQVLSLPQEEFDDYYKNATLEEANALIDEDEINFKSNMEKHFSHIAFPEELSGGFSYNFLGSNLNKPDTLNRSENIQINSDNLDRGNAGFIGDIRKENASTANAPVANGSASNNSISNNNNNTDIPQATPQEFEKMAQLKLLQLRSQLTEFVNKKPEEFNQEKNSKNLPFDKIRKLNNLIAEKLQAPSKLILDKITGLADSKIKDKNSFLYSTLLTESTVGLMSSVVNFKKSIDKTFPGLSDKMIYAGLNCLVAITSIYAPPLALVAKSTGVCTQIGNMLKTDNLEKNLNIIKTNLAEINKDKGLTIVNESYSNNVAIANQFAEPNKASPKDIRSVQQMNFTPLEASQASRLLVMNPESREVTKAIADYCSSYVIENKKVRNNKINELNDYIINKLDTVNIDKSIKQDISAMLGVNLLKNVQLTNGIEQKKPLEKVGIYAQASINTKKLLSEIETKLAKSNPPQKFSEDMKNEITTKIEETFGKTKIIVTEMDKIKDPAVKKFVKESMGSSPANEVILRKESTVQKASLSRRK